MPPLSVPPLDGRSLRAPAPDEQASPARPNPYFKRRSGPPPELTFDSRYFGVRTDPDGTVRNHFEERERKLRDLEEELAFINARAPGKLLDFGCGLGFLLSGIDERWEKHGVEISAFAAGHASQYGRIHLGTVESAGYPSGYFDVVITYHALEHCMDPVTELRELTRVLRPGGDLVVAVPNFESACARRFGDNYRMLHDRTHISLFSDAGMRQLLEDEGYHVDHVSFPFFETAHFTRDNLERLFDATSISPPFWGNLMTFYATKPKAEVARRLTLVARAVSRIALEQGGAVEKLGALLARARETRASVGVFGEDAEATASQLVSAGIVAHAGPTVAPDLAIAVGLTGVSQAPQRLRRGSPAAPLVAIVGENESAALGAELTVLWLPRPEPDLAASVRAQLLASLLSNGRSGPASQQ